MYSTEVEGTMPATTSFFTMRRFGLMMAIVVVVTSILSYAPSAKAFFTFQVTVNPRTATSVTVNWTMRAQEDAPNSVSDVVRVCWAPAPNSNPCAVHSVFMSQSGSVGQWNSYNITGLTCRTSYDVLVAQSYILSSPSTPTSGDWHSNGTTNVPAYANCPC